LTTALAGPYATLLLGGLGARVIKIENPRNPDSCRANAPYLGAEGASLVRRRPDDISVSALNRLRNKEAVTLDLKHARGREVFLDMVRRADVVVENFSRGVMDRLGLGYAALSAVRPQVVYCSISGFGATGEESGSGKAMDTIIQALSGVMMTSGNVGDPPVRVGVPFADMCAPLFAVIGVQAAIHQVRRTGRGQHVDVSMLGVLTSMVAAEPFDVLERVGVPQRTGLTVPRLSPFGLYPAKDGYVAICAPQEQFAEALFRVMGKGELLQDARFATRDARVKHVAEVDAMIAAFTGQFGRVELVRRLEAGGVPAAEVRDPAAAVRDGRVVARAETVRLEHPKYGATDEVFGAGLPIRFSDARAGFDAPPPGFGEHNRPVYCGWLGYSDAELEQLQKDGVIS
jgi:crotonobetainyl-CoA:carnitine CoA-transferase CaiB-like acyl-CoA transferase